MKNKDLKKFRGTIAKHDLSKIKGGVADPGIETSQSKLEHSGWVGLDCVEYGDWWSTC